MKSLAELEQIRLKNQGRVNIRNEKEGDIRIVVGMGTCGISAGARPVMQAFVEEVGKRDLINVTISQSGCMGLCTLEPLVEVYVPGKEKVRYVELTAEKVAEIVEQHIVGGNPVVKYTIGEANK